MSLHDILRQAARADSDELEKLVEGLDETSRNELLPLASERGCIQLVSALLHRGAPADYGLPTPLVLAAENGERAIAECLIDAGARVAGIPWWDDGDHPLVSAAMKADPRMVEILIRAGALEEIDPRWLGEAFEGVLGSVRKTKNAALLTLAEAVEPGLSSGRLTIDAILLKKSSKALAGWSKKGGPSTARVIAARFEQLYDEADAEVDQILGFLDDRRFRDLIGFVEKAQGAQRRRRGGLALIYSINSEIWQTYENRDPDPEGERTVCRLMELDPDPRIRDDSAQTALMAAVHIPRVDLAEELLARGADVLAKDADGRSILDWARLSAKEEVVSWVEQRIRERTSGSSG